MTRQTIAPPATMPHQAPMTDRIAQIHIDDANLPIPTAEIEQERAVAIFDLLEDNSFSLAADGAPGLRHQHRHRQGR